MHRLRGPCIGFQYLIFTLSYSRVLKFFISREIIFQILDQDIWKPLNHSWQLLLILRKCQFAMFFCLKRFHVIGAAVFPFAFILFPVPFMIFTDVIDELMQNYLFLEAFQMLTLAILNHPISARWCKWFMRLLDVLS